MIAIPRLFESVFDVFDGPVCRRLEMDAPRADLREDERGFTLALDAPGFGPDSIEVEVTPDGVLRVSGRQDTDSASEEDRYHVRERSTRSFTRSFRLPAPVAHDRAEAAYANGVLTVTVPRAAAPQSSRVQVKAGAVA